MPRLLSSSEVKRFYDRFGRLQDGQVFYEGRALDEVERNGQFEHAQSVLEFGCGTGAFARRLLRKRLPETAHYLGLDISETMIRIAAKRLAQWSECAVVQQTNGAPTMPVETGSVDRVVINYVLDLMSDQAISLLVGEAHRALIGGGLLAVTNLTCGASAPARVVSRVWGQLQRRWPSATGGCRPIRMSDRLSEPEWTLQHHNVVTQCGVSSEVCVAAAVH